MAADGENRPKLAFGPAHPYARHAEFATVAAVTRDDLRPLPYDGPRSIRALLEAQVERSPEAVSVRIRPRTGCRRSSS